MAPTSAEEVPVTKKARMEPNIPADVSALKNNIVNLQQTIQSIEEIEDEINQIEDKQSEAIIKLEQEFVKQKVPHYSKRAEQIKKIPGFWAKACQQHPQLYCLINEDDKKVFEHLIEIIVDPINVDGTADKHGETVRKTLNFTITFKFTENEWFSNTELIKRFYQFGEDVHSESEEIKWKEGKNLIKASQSKNTAANGDVKPKPDDESFFAWFDDHDDAENDETADAIKEDLYLHALNYYLNEDDSEEEDDDDEDEAGDNDAEIDLNSDDE